jgi:hypothetical protein
VQSLVISVWTVKMESAGSRPKDDVSLPKGKVVISYHDYQWVASLTFILTLLFHLLMCCL